MAQRSFIVTVRTDTDMSVHDVQDAVVDTWNNSRPTSQNISHGETDVELIEVRERDHARTYGANAEGMVYVVLEAC